MIRDDSSSAGNGKTPGSQPDPQQSVRLMDVTGKYVGIITLSEAETFAARRGAKLVTIGPTAKPPIYRLVDDETYQKFFKKPELWTI